MKKRLVTLGDLVLDLLLQAELPLQAGAHQMSQTLDFQPGGVCTTIFAARNMGLDVTALGMVGDDWQGGLLLDQLAAAGVDVSAVQRHAESGTTTVISIADANRAGHVFVGHYGAGPDCQWTRDAADQLARADALFIPGYSLVDERLNPLMARALDFIESQATPLYLDVGPFLGALDGDSIRRVLSMSDALLLTQDEIPLVTGGHRGHDACRELLDACPDLLIVLKLGAAGCHLMSRGAEFVCPGFAVDVVDSIGAGDAFAGAFIWARLNGCSLPDCATIANAMGAASVMKRGAGQNAPTRAETRAILDQDEKGLRLSC